MRARWRRRSNRCHRYKAISSSSSLARLAYADAAMSACGPRHAKRQAARPRHVEYLFDMTMTSAYYGQCRHAFSRIMHACTCQDELERTKNERKRKREGESCWLRAENEIDANAGIAALAKTLKKGSLHPPSLVGGASTLALICIERNYHRN